MYAWLWCIFCAAEVLWPIWETQRPPHKQVDDLNFNVTLDEYIWINLWMTSSQFPFTLSESGITQPPTQHSESASCHRAPFLSSVFFLCASSKTVERNPKLVVAHSWVCVSVFERTSGEDFHLDFHHQLPVGWHFHLSAVGWCQCAPLRTTRRNALSANGAVAWL